MENLFKIELFSRVGQRENNEDNIFPNPEDDYSHGAITNLFLVCDGMGGHEKGEVASDIICTQMSKYFIDNNIQHSDKENIISALQFVESKFDAYLIDNDGSAGMGSTLTLLHLHSYGATLAHVGDSRIYQIREGKIVFQTKDHSLVQQLLDSGVIKTEEEARNHEDKNVILQAVRGASQKATKPSVKIITDLQPNDIFLLCSDGVIESFTDEEFEKVFSSMPSLEAITVKIKEKCSVESSDNFSAILVQLTPTYIQSLEVVPNVEDLSQESNTSQKKNTSTQIFSKADDKETVGLSVENSNKQKTESQTQVFDDVINSVSEDTKITNDLSVEEKEKSLISNDTVKPEHIDEIENKTSIVEDNPSKSDTIKNAIVPQEKAIEAAPAKDYSMKERQQESSFSIPKPIENYAPNPIYEEAPEKNMNKLKLLIVAIVGLLLIGSIYYWINKKEQNNENHLEKNKLEQNVQENQHNSVREEVNETSVPILSSNTSNSVNKQNPNEDEQTRIETQLSQLQAYIKNRNTTEAQKIIDKLKGKRFDSNNKEKHQKLLVEFQKLNSAKNEIEKITENPNVSALNSEEKKIHDQIVVLIKSQKCKDAESKIQSLADKTKTKKEFKTLLDQYKEKCTE